MHHIGWFAFEYQPTIRREWSSSCIEMTGTTVRFDDDFIAWGKFRSPFDWGNFLGYLMYKSGNFHRLISHRFPMVVDQIRSKLVGEVLMVAELLLVDLQ